MSSNLVQSNAVKIPLADKSVSMCVTSPPYWSLRDYGTATWKGGDAECNHVRQKTLTLNRGEKATKIIVHNHDTCGLCGAVRKDDQLGLEPTPDCGAWSRGAHEPYIAWRYEHDSGEDEPYIDWRRTEEIQLCGVCYVCKMVAVFREVWRVLRDDGTCWINLGDSYAGAPPGGGSPVDKATDGRGDRPARYRAKRMRDRRNKGIPTGLKTKDLCGIPWRVAFALQADGWYLRSDIIWSKPNPMPESVTDRPTKAHEYMFLLSKNKKYFYDADAVREKGPGSHPMFAAEKSKSKFKNLDAQWASQDNGRLILPTNPAGRNRRTVWHIATRPYSGAHFATFPSALVEPCIKAGTSEHGVCPACGAGWVRVVEPTNEHAKRIKTFRTMNFDGQKVGEYIQAGIDKNDWSQKQLAEYFPSASGGLTGCVHNWVTGKNIPTAKQYKIIKDVLDLGSLWDELLNNPATGELDGWQEQDMINYGMKGAGDHIPTGKTTTGWSPSCECKNYDAVQAWDMGEFYSDEPPPYEPQPATVLDPFSGAATTGLVCQQLGRNYVGLDLSAEYHQLARKRLGLEALDKWTQGTGQNGDDQDKEHKNMQRKDPHTFHKERVQDDLTDLPMFTPDAGEDTTRME